MTPFCFFRCFDATTDGRDMDSVSIGISEATIDALELAVHSYIQAGIEAAEKGPRLQTSSPVRVLIPPCLVDTGYRRTIRELYKRIEEGKADKTGEDHLTRGLGSLLRGFKYSEIFKDDLAKTEALKKMVNGATARVQKMYSNQDIRDRNSDAFGRLGFAFGLDGNPMYTAVASTPPILSLSLPVPVVSDPDSGAESKAEHVTGSDADVGHGPDSVEDMPVSGIPGKFHFGLVGKGARGKVGAYFTDPLYSMHRRSQNALKWINKPGDPRSWHIEFLQDVMAQLAVSSLECARYLNLDRRPTPEEVYACMIARAGECETAEYHLFLLIIDVSLLQLAQCELAGEARQWEHSASVLELVFAVSNSFKYMRLRVLECIRWAIASNRERILLDTLLFARMTAGDAMWSLDLLMEKFVYQFRDLMRSREWKQGSWSKAESIVQSFPEQMALRRAAGNRVIKNDSHGRPIQGSDSLLRPSKYIFLGEVFVLHFDFYYASKLWVLGSNLWLFPKGPYKPTVSPADGTPFTARVTLDNRPFSEYLVRRLVFEAERRCVTYVESFGVQSNIRAVSLNSDHFPAIALNRKVPANHFKLFNLSHVQTCDNSYFDHLRRLSFVPSALTVNLPGTKKGVITPSAARGEILRRLKKKKSVASGGLPAFDLFESAEAKSLSQCGLYTKQSLSDMIKLDIVTLLCTLRRSHHSCLSAEKRAELYPPYVAPEVTHLVVAPYRMPRIIHHRREAYPSPDSLKVPATADDRMWATMYKHGPVLPAGPAVPPGPGTMPKSAEVESDDEIIRFGDEEEIDEELNLRAETGPDSEEEEEEEDQDRDQDGEEDEE